MIFASPFLLFGLAALPVIFILLRLTPPPARRIRFPPLALLQNLPREQRTPRRPPLWILLLRIAAAALIILGLAGPSLHPPVALPDAGPILLVIDNGWASAADWPQRIAAANGVIASAGPHRGIALLATAPGATGAPPEIQGVFNQTQANAALAALQPQPWPVDRTGATRALQTAPEPVRIYIADGIGGLNFTPFMQALRPDRIINSGIMPALLAPAHLATTGGLVAHLLTGPRHAAVLAQDAAGATLARVPVDAAANAIINLPLPLANKITTLRLDGTRSVGGTVLLDAASHVQLVGLSAGSGDPNTPFMGTLYFLRRALPSNAQIITGDPVSLIQSKATMIVLADTPLSAPQQAALKDYISRGGVVVRFAGPLTTATPDPLSPDPLLAGDRRLGGALSWTTPLSLAAFPANSPLAGLAPNPAATVSRQILPDPTTLDPATVWSTLKDGTPLVLGRPIGKGYLVSILTTANGDWSNLPLSGLFPAMLARLSLLTSGSAINPGIKLALHAKLSAFGEVAPASSTSSLTVAAMANSVVSPAHPAGYYGSGAGDLAFNLADHIPAPEAAPLPGGIPFSGAAAPIELGPKLLGLAMLLLSADLAISLWLRGLLRLQTAIFLLPCCLLPQIGHAQPALQTQLGFILTNDAYTDQISADGLAWLSADVSAHTSAQLGAPIGLNPAKDDLGLYPFIYWPILPSASAPAPAACAAINIYMAHGGLLVIDQPGGDPGGPGSGAGFAAGAGAALARATACLNRPPLEPLVTADILTRCFYIMHDFPGRFVGAPVYIANASARDADSVTPIIIGQNDWAGAWARDATGIPEQTPLPGGEDQRILAGRFGTNLVIYALTGNYKGDQNNIPHLLDQLGQ